MKRFFLMSLAVALMAPALAVAQRAPAPDIVAAVNLHPGALPLLPAAMPAVVPPAIARVPVLAAMDLSPLKGLLTPENVIGGILVLLGLIAGALHLSDRRKRQLATGAYYAFHIVEDLDAAGDLKVPKVEEGLKQLDAWMLANGWRALKPGEQAVAKLAFSALNGQTKVAIPLAGSAPVPSVPAAG